MKSVNILLLRCLLWRPVAVGADTSPAEKRGFSGRYRIIVQTAKGKHTTENDLLIGKPNVFQIQAQ